jgi:predicted transposase YdaD
VVVLLLAPPPETVIETAFSLETTYHEYRVIRMWEENPEVFLNQPSLLPLAPLAATTQPQILLQRVVEQVDQLEPEQRPEISAYTQILAGLKYDQDLIRRLFQEGMMRESVIYQEILAEGEQRGERRGEQRGEQRERALILRLLNKRVGELPQQVRLRLEILSLEQLEKLGEALLDFQAISDLETWLSTFN